MAQKKYVSLSKLSTFLENLKCTFATLSHKHTMSDITDYTVDAALSSTSTNPVQNKVINEEFDAITTSKVNVSDIVNNLTTNLAKKPLSAAMGFTINDLISDLQIAVNTHTHSISNVTNLQSTLDSKAANTVATQTENGLLSAEDKIQLDYGGIPIASTSGDGAAYTAVVNGMTSLTVGMSFMMIPHTVSTSTAPTLNVNNLGAKTIRRRVSNATQSTSAGYNASWLSANKPIMVTYDGMFWIADILKPSAADVSGTFGGQVVANSSGQDVGTPLLRNSKLVFTETNPTVNGEICWTYE